MLDDYRLWLGEVDDSNILEIWQRNFISTSTPHKAVFESGLKLVINCKATTKKHEKGVIDMLIEGNKMNRKMFN